MYVKGSDGLTAKLEFENAVWNQMEELARMTLWP
jgi:hypothetical protein